MTVSIFLPIFHILEEIWRCAAGAFLLQRAGVENSIGGLFFVGGFSGFFGSMLVLPMMLGSHLASFRVDAWESGAWTLDLGVITGRG